MAVQDDAREVYMGALFNLTVPPDRVRHGLDAHLNLGGGTPLVPFELKSTSGPNVSTVRDLGPAHIAKWQHMHWLFAFYSQGGTALQYSIYASPADMRPWIAGKERYVRPDLLLAKRLPELVGDSDVTEVLGDGESFSIQDARSVMKRQWSSKQYRDRADLPGGRYSRPGMLGLLRERCGYVVRRGSTLNNPHIPASYFTSFERITTDHASRLRHLVRDYLEQAAAARSSGDGPPEGEVDPLVLEQAKAAAGDNSEDSDHGGDQTPVVT